MGARTRALALLLTAAAAAAPHALAQGGGVLGQGSDEAAAAAETFPQALPVDLDDLEYRFDFDRAGGATLTSGWFDPRLDTPAFSNQRFENNALDVSTAVCGGIGLLTYDWFHQVVVPIRNQSDWAFWRGDDGLEVSPILSTKAGTIKGPAHRGNLDSEYRLRLYSEPEDQRPLVVRFAVNNQRVWRQLDPGVDWGEEGENHAHVWEAIQDHAGEKTEVLTPIYFVLKRLRSGRSSAHAVLAFAAQLGVAVAEGGPEREAYYVPIVDPNVVLRDSNASQELKTRYLLYFPDVQRFSFGKEYRDHWARAGRSIQTGTFLGDREIGYMPYADARTYGVDLQLRSSDVTEGMSDSALLWDAGSTSN